MKATTILAILVLALGLASVSLAAEGTWTRKTDMPTGRGYLSTAIVNGKIYAIGGAIGSTTGCSAVEEYDPATDTWTKKANLPAPRSGLFTSVVDGKIYAIGGATSPLGAVCSSVYVYDPATDTWMQKADMPTARIVLSASVVDGKIYAIGGASSGGSPALKTVEEYEPTMDIWTRKAAMPTARGFLCTSVVNGKIYAIGGASTKFGPVLSTVEMYDPVTDIWVTRADIPTARGWLSTSVVAGKIYAIGGASAAATLQNLSTVEEYDPVTDTWITRVDMPTARRILSTSAVDGKIYAIGGLAGAWGTAAIPTGIVEEYDTGLGVPSPDFNGDGIVDSADMCIMVDYWGTDEPLCDIGPTPFGDGIVDVQDLIVLSEYFFKELNDPTLVAHWAFDEIEGDIASDSANDNDGTVYGNPAWQPEGGMVDGALQLDGIDDYIRTPFVLNPADGKFSVFVWIKGGAPDQAVVSQAGGANWILADASEGKLMTELKATGRDATELLSQTIITDGNWHRIGLVWDGSHRTLYVDDVAVAEDEQTNLAALDNGLYIGTGKAMEPGSFWSGLIDDVRIYNRAVIP